MITVRVSQFGPIAKGEVSLKPLTVFVGPNNTGKSYLAMLIYAIFHSSRYEHYRFEPVFAPVRYSPRVRSLNALRDWLQTLEKSPRGKLNVHDLPPELQKGVLEVVQKSLDAQIPRLGKEIERCFGRELRDLVTTKRAKVLFRIAVESTDPHWDMKLSLSDKNLQGTYSLDTREMEFKLPGFITGIAIRGEMPKGILKEILFYITKSVRDELEKNFADAAYLPAARSGILQSHKALVQLMVGHSSLVGIEPFSIPKLSGVVTDFISNLIGLEKQRNRPLARLARLLEGDVMHGEIEMKTSRAQYPEIYYRSAAGVFPLQATSSMVSELAPVSLFLKYFLDPGDFLIVEEPESHLHPESQRNLAHVIVRLIRKNVHVLITTHSDYFLAQLSNFVRLSSVTEAERAKQGYLSDDFVRPEEVTACLFEPDPEKKGIVIRQLPISASEGIPEDAFQRVYEALYAETVRLERSVSD